MKLERLEIRLPAPEKSALERSAVALNVSVSAYVRQRLGADLTGDALAHRIAELIAEQQDSAMQELLDAMTEHRGDFDIFRQNLGAALKQLLSRIDGAT